MKAKILDLREIDWNQAWREGRKSATSPVRDEKFWDNRASSYAQAASETGYAEKFLAIMNPRAHWQVLDMACGGGTLAIPLANRVKAVTAVDFSSSMLAILQKRCQDLGIDNIRPLKGSWEDDWDALGIGLHDVAIASRSLVADDLRGSLVKLDRVARERVYLVMTVGDGPHDRRMFEAIGRPLHPRPDYIYAYNLLYQMGIYPEVAFIHNEDAKTFADPEEAWNASQWMFHRLSRTEEDKLRSFILHHLVCRDGKWSFDYRRVVRWAVIWWTK